MNKKFTLFVCCALIISSLYIINAQTALETIAINEEEVFVKIDKTSDYSVSNYSYPSFYNHPIERNFSIDSLREFAESKLTRWGFLDTLTTNGFSSLYPITNRVYGLDNAGISSRNSTIAYFDNSDASSYVAYQDNTHILPITTLRFDIGVIWGNFSHGGRILTLATTTLIAGERLTIDINDTHVQINLIDGMGTNYAFEHFNQTTNLRVWFDSNNFRVYINNVLNYSVHCGMLFGINNHLWVGWFDTQSSVSANIYQIHCATIDLTAYDLTIPFFNPTPLKYEITNVIVQDLICYNSSIYTFKSNTTIDKTTFSFQALFSTQSEFTFFLTSNTSEYEEFNIRETGNIHLAEIVHASPPEPFNLIVVNETQITLYANQSLVYTVYVDFTDYTFNELNFVFSNETLLRGWNSDYPFRITPADNIDSLVYELFCVFDEQTLKRVDEFHEPLLGLLTSNIFPYYGSINYSNFNQTFDSDIFLCDSMLLNAYAYLENDSSYFFGLTGNVGRAFINYEEGGNRSYIRALFSKSGFLYKVQLTCYDLDNNIATNRIIEHIYPIQLEFYYNNLTNRLYCLNFQSDIMNISSNESISLHNYDNLRFVVANEHFSNQTWSNSNYTRQTMAIIFNKDFSYYGLLQNSLSERLVSIETNIQIVNSELNIASANNYEDIENDITNQQYNLATKFGQTAGLVAVQDSIISKFVYNHQIGQAYDYEQNYAPIAASNFLLDIWYAWFPPPIEGPDTDTELGRMRAAWDYDPSIAVEATETLISDTFNIEIDFTAVLEGLQTVLTNVITGISQSLLDVANFIKEQFFTLTNDLMTDLVNFNSEFENFSPKSNDVSVAFITQTFLTDDITNIRMLFTTTWLITQVLDGQSVLSFFIGLGVSLLIVLTIPIVVHHLKKNPVLTYMSCLISVLVCIIIGILDLGIGLVAMFFASVLLIFKLKANKGGL